MTYDILTILCGKQVLASSPIILQGFTSGDNICMTGTLLRLSQAYCICKGTVVSVSRDYDGLFVVTIQYSADKWIRYCHLDVVAVSNNQKVNQCDLIGHAHHNELRFEYCTLEESQHIVRISNQTCYKHDPIGILYGMETLPTTPNTIYVPSEEMKVVYEKPLNIYKNNLSSIMNNPGR